MLIAAKSLGWWAWLSWLEHLVVAQEVVGSSPIVHPIQRLQAELIIVFLQPYHPRIAIAK